MRSCGEKKSDRRDRFSTAADPRPEWKHLCPLILGFLIVYNAGLYTDRDPGNGVITPTTLARIECFLFWLAPPPHSIIYIERSARSS